MRIIFFLIATLLLSCGPSLPDDPNTPVIEMSRNGSYGSRVEYTIEIYSEGRVLYFLRDMSWGAGCYWATRISEEKLHTLVDAIRDSKFLKKDWPSIYAIGAATTSLTYCWERESMTVTFTSDARELVQVAEQIDSLTRKDLALQVLAEESNRTKQQRLKGKNPLKLEFESGELQFTRFNRERHAPIYSVSIQSTGKVDYNEESDPDTSDERVTWIDSTDAKGLIGSVAYSTLMFSKDSSFADGWKQSENPDIQIRITLDHLTHTCNFSDNAPGRLTQIEYLVNEMSGTPHWMPQEKFRKSKN